MCTILLRACVLTVKERRTAGSPGQRMDSYSGITVAPCGHWIIREISILSVMEALKKKGGGDNALKMISVINVFA